MMYATLSHSFNELCNMQEEKQAEVLLALLRVEARLQDLVDIMKIRQGKYRTC
jgi:hypothetical protein